MKKKKLGNSEMMITEVGIGTWAIGGPWEFGWGTQNESDSIQAIQSALDKGINWIDTAAVYGWGYSEEMVGKAIKGRRNDLYVFTKCGMVKNSKGKIENNLKPESIRKEVESSLKRLAVDCIDLYQFHWPDPNTQIEDSWQVMLDLIKEGKIRYAGVSNHDVTLLKKIVSTKSVTSVQPLYNLISRQAEKELFSYTIENNIGSIVYSPMASGFLTESFDKERLDKKDWRKYCLWAKEPNYSRIQSLVKKLSIFGKSIQRSSAQIAIGWAIQNRSVTGAIVGVRNSKQVMDLFSIQDFSFTDEQVNEIKKIFHEVGEIEEFHY